jgi:hypothetical protein
MLVVIQFNFKMHDPYNVTIDCLDDRYKKIINLYLITEF